MKKIFPIIIIVVAAIVVISMIGSKPSITDQEAVQIVQHQYVKNPTFAVAVKDKGDTYIVASINDDKTFEERVLVLKQVADLWQEQSEPKGFTNSTMIVGASNAKAVSVGGNSYVFFTTESYGSAAGSVYFNLISPSEMHVYSIGVSGGNGNINQIGEIPADVKSNQDIYSYLTQQISESSKIAHTSQQNLNVDSPDNAVQKWQLDNENIWKGMLNYAFPVKFTYYDANLLDSWKGTTVTGSIENDNYKIVSFFKGVAIGLDKTKNKYFVLWVPSDMYEWPTDISFIDANTVHISSANSGPSVTVHLDTNTVSSP